MRTPRAAGAPGATRPATATATDDPAARHVDGEPAGAAGGAGPAGSPSPGGDAASPAPTGPVRAPSGPLQPIELATASVLAGVTVILVLAGWLIPHASGLIGLAVVPMAVVAHRHRPRAVVASTVAAGTVSFLVAGTGPLPTIALCAIVGGIAGHAHRRRWRWPTVLAAALLAGPALGGFIDLALLAFAPLRRLTLTDARNTWDGYARLVGKIPALQPVAHQATLVVHAVLQYWWATILVAVVVVCLVATWATWYYARGLLYRLQRVPVEDRLAASPEAGPAAGGLPGGGGVPGAGGGVAAWPVPVQLDGVRVRYPGATAEALAGVSLTISPRERTVVLGPNGSGKSTLARLLAGRPPTGGRIVRPGAIGLGAPGGTAFVAQHPESQVLGVRVADDLVWGLPRDWPVDVDGLLATVGLAGLATRETSGLSGGQLQRLALGAALARRPSLLIGDEVTAMVDAGGRDELVALLSRLPRERGVAVVQVTHRVEEVAGADHLARLVGGRLVADERPPGAVAGRAPVAGAGAAQREAPGGDTTPSPAATTPAARPMGGGRRPDGRIGPDLLVVDDVSHTYADRTPWAQTALQHVSLSVRSGEGVLVMGDNGSGKTTLAWVMAGLLRPTEGECRVGGAHVRRRVGSVALAFQHARLQVQGATVGADVRAAGGVERPAAEAALARLGLDPAVLWDRAVDTLSGGQLRRVALAGLLASEPEVLLLDEPLAGLDEDSRDALLAALLDLRRRQGLTVVVISHDQEAAVVCDRVVRLEGGRVVEDLPLGEGTGADAPATAAARDVPGAAR